jgi:hypothetical protein
VVGVLDEVVVVVAGVLSLQPNHPGVWQVLVLIELLDEVVLVEDSVVVVLSSRHPHHPGVLQVSVLVLEEVVVGAVVVVVEGFVCVPFSNFHK